MNMSRYLRKSVKRGLKGLKKYRFRSSNSGFTLTEILISMIVAGIIMSGLMTVMVELLTSDARETARTETQREMQMAMDYIAADIREAVFVYDGDCLDGKTDTCGDGLFDSLDVPESTVPILAFWKLDDLPEAVMEDCNFDNLQETPYCVSGRTYTLVVYFFTDNNVDGAGGPWAGMGRIRRAVHRRFDASGDPNPNYVPFSDDFARWPNGRAVSMSTPVTLVDFVDAREMQTIAEVQQVQGMEVGCPENYNLTPSDKTLNHYGFEGVRNFYACVLDEVGRQERAGADNDNDEELTAFNQKVILFIRGNAAGKPGIRSANEGFMPAIQTQVLNRSIRQKDPQRF